MTLYVISVYCIVPGKNIEPHNMSNNLWKTVIWQRLMTIISKSYLLYYDGVPKKPQKTQPNQQKLIPKSFIRSIKEFEPQFSCDKACSSVVVICCCLSYLFFVYCRVVIYSCLHPCLVDSAWVFVPLVVEPHLYIFKCYNTTVLRRQLKEWYKK